MKKRMVVDDEGNNKTKVGRVLLIPIFQARRHGDEKGNAGLITVTCRRLGTRRP